MTPPITQSFSKEHIFHSSEYLYRKKYIKPGSTITVLGSGQSGGEIFYDLLTERKEQNYQLNWITAADRFFPMENSKFTYEFTSMDYVKYFNKLSIEKKKQVISKQDVLYKGINNDLISLIYDELYYQQLEISQDLPVKIIPNSLLSKIVYEDDYTLEFIHQELDHQFCTNTDFLILATGYSYKEPSFLENISSRLRRDKTNTLISSACYSIDINDNEVFMLNGCIDSQGIIASDLGMGPYRNSIIINKILGYNHFEIEEQVAFQNFGATETTI